MRRVDQHLARDGFGAVATQKGQVPATGGLGDQVLDVANSRATGAGSGGSTE